MRPLLDDDNYKRMEELAKDFEETVGSKLQRYLVLKSWWSTNYVSDWWEEYVYLRGRGALMVNSNFYGIDALFLNNTTVQTARAAVVVNLLLNFRRSVERQELQPVSASEYIQLSLTVIERHIFKCSFTICCRLWSKDWFHCVHGNTSAFSTLYGYLVWKQTKLYIIKIRITLW